MKKTASTEASGCRIEAAQDVKRKSWRRGKPMRTESQVAVALAAVVLLGMAPCTGAGNSQRTPQSSPPISAMFAEVTLVCPGCRDVPPAILIPLTILVEDITADRQKVNVKMKGRGWRDPGEMTSIAVLAGGPMILFGELPRGNYQLLAETWGRTGAQTGGRTEAQILALTHFTVGDHDLAFAGSFELAMEATGIHPGFPLLTTYS
jgi:hypothetical protein